jgi:hypothetical protein
MAGEERSNSGAIQEIGTRFMQRTSVSTITAM